MPQILSIDAIARNACIAGRLSTAEELFTREIDIDCNSYIYESYANRSLVVARKHDWDHALEDAIKVRCRDPPSYERLTFVVT